MKHIPNLLTLLNLSCGCMAIVLFVHNQIEMGSYCLVVAALFDLLDGALARLLHVSGPLGTQLDSLADLVSFGVAPACYLWNLYNQLWHVANPLAWNQLANLTLIIVASSAYRLAKFNLDQRQTTHFIGVPTPANTLFLLSLYPWLSSGASPTAWYVQPWFFVTLCLSSAAIMHAPIPLLSFKINFRQPAKYPIQILLLSISLPLIILFQLKAILPIFIFYLLLSIIFFKPTIKI